MEDYGFLTPTEWEEQGGDASYLPYELWQRTQDAGKNVLEVGTGTWNGAIEHGQVVLVTKGAMLAGMGRVIPRGNVAELGSMQIDAAHRRKGLTRRLIARLLTLPAAEQAAAAVLITKQGNGAMLHAAGREGFKEVHDLRNVKECPMHLHTGAFQAWRKDGEKDAAPDRVLLMRRSMEQELWPNA